MVTRADMPPRNPVSYPLYTLPKVPLTWLEGFYGDKSGHAAQKPGELPLVHLTKGALTQFLITQHRHTLNLVLLIVFWNGMHPFPKGKERQ
jgi:hypothetical protein